MSALESFPVHCWKLRPCLKRRSPGYGGTNAILSHRVSDRKMPWRSLLGLPPVDLIQDRVGFRLSVFTHKVLTHPINKMILEHTLDELVEEVWGYQFIDIRTRKMFGEWLIGRVSESPCCNHDGTETYLDIANDPVTFPKHL